MNWCKLLHFAVLFSLFTKKISVSLSGLMAGSNRSGDLANPQFSIPVGTISAVLVTSVICILLITPRFSFATLRIKPPLI